MFLEIDTRSIPVTAISFEQAANFIGNGGPLDLEPVHVGAHELALPSYGGHKRIGMRKDAYIQEGFYRRDYKALRQRGKEHDPQWRCRLSAFRRKMRRVAVEHDELSLKDSFVLNEWERKSLLNEKIARSQRDWAREQEVLFREEMCVRETAYMAYEGCDGRWWPEYVDPYFLEEFLERGDLRFDAWFEKMSAEEVEFFRRRNLDFRFTSSSYDYRWLDDLYDDYGGGDWDNDLWDDFADDANDNFDLLEMNDDVLDEVEPSTPVRGIQVNRQFLTFEEIEDLYTAA